MQAAFSHLQDNGFIKRQNKNKTRFFVKEVVLKSEYIGEDAVREKYDAQMKT